MGWGGVGWTEAEWRWTPEGVVQEVHAMWNLRWGCVRGESAVHWVRGCEEGFKGLMSVS